MRDPDDPRGWSGRRTQPSPRFCQSLPALIAVANFDGYFRSVNAAFHRVLGWSYDEIASAPYWEFLHCDDQHEMVEAGQVLINDGSISGHEARMLCRDGTYRWIRWDAAGDAEDELVCLVGTDVTDRKPADGTPRELVATWSWDLVADVVTGSVEFAEMFGVARNSSAPYSVILDRLHPEDRPPINDDIQWSLLSGEQYVADFRVSADRGTYRWIHSSGRIVSFRDGRPERMDGIAIDTTTHHRFKTRR